LPSRRRGVVRNESFRRLTETAIAMSLLASIAVVSLSLASPAITSQETPPTTAPAAATPTAAPHAMDKQRLLSMLLSGDDGMIVATFRRYPGRTLPFVDGFLEGGLAMIEKKGDAGELDAQQSYRTGIKFAKLADQAFGGTDFSDYANAFASWSREEQRDFREGQKLFREGMKLAKEDRAKAIATLERSLRITERLDDTWGQVMAQGGLARLHIEGESDEAAVRAESSARAAANLARKVRLDEDRIVALRHLARAIKRLGQKAEAQATPLQEAWTLLRRYPSFDAELRDGVGADLIAVFEAMKRPDAVEVIKAELAEMAQSAAPAAEAKPE
jgi:hypothetical protein